MLLLLRPPGGSGGKGKGRAEVQGPSGAPGISGMGRAMQARARRHRQQPQGLGALISAGKNILRSIFAGAALLALPVDAQEHRFEADPVVTVHENLARHRQPAFPPRRRVRPAARRRSGPRLRKAWTIRLHLSARHDFALQMDARESVIEIMRAARITPSAGSWLGHAGRRHIVESAMAMRLPTIGSLNSYLQPRGR